MLLVGPVQETGMEGGSVYPVPAPATTGAPGAASPPAGGGNAKSVHALRFLTPDPLDHCSRAFDVVRRMGFHFVSVGARPAPSACFLVRLKFIPNGHLPASLLADRISGFVGVTDVEFSADERSS